MELKELSEVLIDICHLGIHWPRRVVTETEINFGRLIAGHFRIVVNKTWVSDKLLPQLLESHVQFSFGCLQQDLAKAMIVSMGWEKNAGPSVVGLSHLLISLLGPSGSAHVWSLMYRFHLLIEFCWDHLMFMTCGSDRIQHVTGHLWAEDHLVSASHLY